MKYPPNETASNGNNVKFMLSRTNIKNTADINTATPILAIWTFFIIINAAVFKAAICTPNTTNSAIRVPTVSYTHLTLPTNSRV